MKMRSHSIELIQNVKDYLHYIYQYKEMLKSLVIKDFKGKFDYTVLGYFWHLIHPLFQIIIYYAVFTVVFGNKIENYWVYISVGMFAYTFMASSINQGCNSIINGKNMVTKMAFAREILPTSKVLTNLLNLSISYCLLIILILISGVTLSTYILYLPIIVMLMLIFTVGAALFCSAITVYLRDFGNAISIILGVAMFSTPIFYVSSQVNSIVVFYLSHINPMYYYIESIHNIMYYNIGPSPTYIIIAIICSIMSISIGLFTFKKLEIGFSERL